MRTRFRWVVRALLPSALLSAGIPPGAGAQIWNNGGPTGAGGNEMSAFVQANDFELASATTLTAVRFWGFSCGTPGYSGSIFWQILADGGGNPAGAALFSGLVTPTAAQRTPDTVGGACGPSYQYDFSVSASLGAGTYWLALHNGPLSSDSWGEFFWETSNKKKGGKGDLGSHEDTAPFGDDAWVDTGFEHAFQLFDASDTVVPEPATLVLLATGMLGVGCGGCIRRRRSQRPS